ncbi:hypothetical protein AOX63_08400 [Pseudomonas sp. ADP]|nr:hypothetical protein AOX63_08400 [Pseudomonas sp. ADP]
MPQAAPLQVDCVEVTTPVPSFVVVVLVVVVELLHTFMSVHTVLVETSVFTDVVEPSAFVVVLIFVAISMPFDVGDFQSQLNTPLAVPQFCEPDVLVSCFDVQDWEPSAPDE